MSTQHNLLTEPLLRVRGDDGSTLRATLPEMLARLGRDAVVGFPAVAPHQRHAWHAFLVQLAAIALHAAGETGVEHPPERWAELLRALTAGYGGDAPWCLAVEDLAQPAFLQPPVPEGNLGSFKNATPHPDALDLLVTAKNHDLKMARMGAPEPDQWVVALVSLQTMEGFGGAGNYGISRMNGGYGSRAAVSRAWSERPGDQWVRDTLVLLDARAGICQRFGYPPSGGHALLWLLPWDGTEGLALTALDPCYVEVCRRVRLTPGAEGLAARATTSRTTRVSAKGTDGAVGDPWLPVERKQAKALSLSANGFSYRLMQALLFSDEYERPPMLEPHPVDEGKGALLVIARALARGQGQTNGYYERVVPIPREMIPYLDTPDRRDRLAMLAGKRVDRAATARNRVLRPALYALFHGGPERVNWQSNTAADWARPWLQAFDRAVDEQFFPDLWAAAHAEFDPEGEDAAWWERLRNLGLQRLEQAMEGAPHPTGRHYAAVAGALRMFHGALYRHAPQLRPDSGAEDDHPQGDANHAG